MFYYLLGDHASTLPSTSLGPTSIVTFENGNLLSETRYKAWGEVRYTSGVTPTNYTYTGQYSYTQDFGLMFYNARWYDPSLGRFAQADSIVPPGAQGLDRYAYVNNSPMNYVDPSGHCAIDDSMDDCYSTDNVNRAKGLIQKAKDNPGKKAYGKYALNAIANLYGINLSPTDHWEYEPFLETLFGDSDPGPLATTPRTGNEQYYVYDPEPLPAGGVNYITANDSSVYVTGVGLDSCNSQLSCIATLMVHEAFHSWIEYSIGGSNPVSVSQDINLERELRDNEELAINQIGKEVFPIGIAHFEKHSSSVEGSCAYYNHNCLSPYTYVETALNVDLSNISDLVLP